MPRKHPESEIAERARRVEMGRRIESARVKLGLQKRELAALVGVSAAAYSGWIAGKHSLSAENFARLVAVTGEPSSFFTPEPIAKRDTIERLARALGARLGKARLEKLLDLPENDLRKEIDAVIGARAVALATRPQRNR